MISNTRNVGGGRKGIESTDTGALYYIEPPLPGRRLAGIIMETDNEFEL
jgi:hypothetical protein